MSRWTTAWCGLTAYTIVEYGDSTWRSWRLCISCSSSFGDCRNKVDCQPQRDYLELLSTYIVVLDTAHSTSLWNALLHALRLCYWLKPTTEQTKTTSAVHNYSNTETLSFRLAYPDKVVIRHYVNVHIGYLHKKVILFKKKLSTSTYLGHENLYAPIPHCPWDFPMARVHGQKQPVIHNINNTTTSLHCTVQYEDSWRIAYLHIYILHAFVYFQCLSLI